MDGRYRGLYRGLVADGLLVNFIIDTIQNLDPDSNEAKEIFKWLRFYNDRMTNKWRLGYEQGEMFPIAKLPDSTIVRLIESGSAKRCQEAWLKYGDNVREVWSTGQWSGERRSAYAVVLEEAEYRNILTEAQKIWKMVRDTEGEKLSEILSDKILFEERCNTRGGHVFMLIDDVHQCVNCRKKVTCEEILKRANAMLRGRLRLAAC